MAKNNREHLLNKLEELKFKHQLLDRWISELKFDSNEKKEKKIQKMKMKEQINSIEQELANG